MTGGGRGVRNSAVRGDGTVEGLDPGAKRGRAHVYGVVWALPRSCEKRGGLPAESNRLRSIHVRDRPQQPVVIRLLMVASWAHHRTHENRGEYGCRIFRCPRPT